MWGYYLLTFNWDCETVQKGVDNIKDLYSIQEFAELSGVEASTLRYWDDIGVFVPIKRSPENNYRYYSLPQIFALHFVTTLSDLGIPLKKIAELKADRNAEDILRLLEKRDEELDMELRTLRLRSSIIHSRQKLIRRGLSVDEKQLSIEHFDQRNLFMWPRNEYKKDETYIEAMARSINQLKKSHVDLGYPIGGCYDNIESFHMNTNRPDYFFTVDPLGNYYQPAGDYLVGYSRGFYGDMGDLPKKMATFAATNSLNLTGKVYAVYLIDEICLEEKDSYLAQICTPI